MKIYLAEIQTCLLKPEKKKGLYHHLLKASNNRFLTNMTVTKTNQEHRFRP